MTSAAFPRVLVENLGSIEVTHLLRAVQRLGRLTSIRGEGGSHCLSDCRRTRLQQLVSAKDIVAGRDTDLSATLLSCIPSTGVSCSCPWSSDPG